MKASLLPAPLLPVVLLAAGCGVDVGLSQNALCDGILQPGEEMVDDAFDRDGDGYFDGANAGCASVYPAHMLDCDDARYDVNPGEVEAGCDGVDNDCDEATPDDEDGDGDGVSSCDDCDDLDPAVHPGASEVTCNLKDDDCDAGTPDEPDADGDGWSVCEDCDDGERTVHPEGEEICDDGLDNDCNGEPDDACAIVYDGIWALDQAVDYTCFGNQYNITFSRIRVSTVDTGSQVRITIENDGGTSVPGPMSGVLSEDGTFSAARTVAGACNEEHTVSGRFLSADQVELTYAADFTIDPNYASYNPCGVDNPRDAFEALMAPMCRYHDWSLFGVRR